MMDKKTITEQEYKEFKEGLINDILDILDEIEVYEDCVMGIHKHTYKHAVASPMSFNKEYDTYSLAQFIRSDGDDDFEVDENGVEAIVQIYFETK